MIKIQFSAQSERWDVYEAPLRKACAAAGLTVDIGVDHAPEDVDYVIFAPNGPVKDFRPYTKCKALLSLWAGVEGIIKNPTVTQPIVRMVDFGLTQGMVEWVVGHTMRLHLGMDAHIHGQDGRWRELIFPPLSRDRPATVLGLGELGTACAIALRDLGFPVTGWSRRQKTLAGIQCLHGETGLKTALNGAEVVVLLLPGTAATENTLNAETLALLADGAFIINPGRGQLIDDHALLEALDSGQVGHATLDVFRTEPLPPDHPYWQHQKVTVTPHIASFTRPETAAEVIAKTIADHGNGHPLRHVVDRTAGY